MPTRAESFSFELHKRTVTITTDGGEKLTAQTDIGFDELTAMMVFARNGQDFIRRINQKDEDCA